MADSRPVCKYDPKCYQTNPAHRQQYRHPSREGPAASATAQHVPPVAPTLPQPTAPQKPAAAPKPAATRGSLRQPSLFEALLTPKATSNKVPQPPAPKPAAAVILGDDAPCTTSAPSAPVVAAASAVPTTAERRDPPSPPKPRAQPSAEQPAAVGPTAQPEPQACHRTEAPAPRSSPLQGDGTTAAVARVFEMPFDDDEMAAIFAEAQMLNPAAPLTAWAGCELVGPFEILAGGSFPSDSAKWNCGRAVTDPPEVQCVAVFSARRLRVLLHRDDPAEKPGLVVTSTSADGQFRIVGPSLAVCLADLIDGAKSEGTKRLRQKFAQRPGFTDEAKSVKARHAKCVARTANHLGVVVPYNKRTELGYREPMIERGKLLRMLRSANDGKLSPKQREELDEQLRFNDISNDECDFGLGLELGLDFLRCVKQDTADPSTGTATSVSAHAESLLTMAYTLLGRDLFAHIVRCSLSRLK